LEVEEHTPIRHQRVLEVDRDGTAAAASEQNYAAWKEARDALLSRASQPSISVQTVTAFARMEAAKQPRRGPPIQVEMVERGDTERPSSREARMSAHLGKEQQ
jgi:hypothetical protein